MYNNFFDNKIIFNLIKYTRLKFLIIILFIYTINIKKSYSYELNDDILFYNYENLTDYLNFASQHYLSSFTSVYHKDKTLNKNEVLKIKDKFYLSYYCRNNICVQVNCNYLPAFVEIPDEKGNIKRYISETIFYNDFKSNKYSAINYCGFYNNKDHICQIIISTECTSDSQCLTNKCINNVCISNEVNPSEYCSNIYSFSFIFGRHSYMYCGKAVGDICETDNDCGTKHCLEDGSCGKAAQPSDSDGLGEAIILMYLSVIILFISCCCCTCLIIKLKIKGKSVIKYFCYFLYNEVPWIFYFLIIVFCIFLYYF